MLTVTVSGSFHRHLRAIWDAVQEATAEGMRVLSPADPRIVAAAGEFLYVASDRVRSVRLVQDRHMEAIRASDFLWLVAPDGYVGQSASMEIGFAAASGIPVYGQILPADLTLQQYVHQVPTMRQAKNFALATGRTKPATVLIDPHASVEAAHATLDRIAAALSPRCLPSAHRDPAAAVLADARRLRESLTSITH